MDPYRPPMGFGYGVPPPQMGYPYTPMPLTIPVPVPVLKNSDNRTLQSIPLTPATRKQQQKREPERAAFNSAEEEVKRKKMEQTRPPPAAPSNAPPSLMSIPYPVPVLTPGNKPQQQQQQQQQRQQQRGNPVAASSASVSKPAQAPQQAKTPKKQQTPTKPALPKITATSGDRSVAGSAAGQKVQNPGGSGNAAKPAAAGSQPNQSQPTRLQTPPPGVDFRGDISAVDEFIDLSKKKGLLPHFIFLEPADLEFRSAYHCLEIYFDCWPNTTWYEMLGSD